MENRKEKPLLIVSALFCIAGVVLLGMYLLGDGGNGWTLPVGLLLVIVANVLFMKAGPFKKGGQQGK